MSARVRHGWAVVAFLVTAACTVGSVAAPSRALAAPAKTKATIDPSGKLFDASRVHDVVIDIAAVDIPLLQPGGEARAHATLTVDGVTVHDVGVRMKQGFGNYRPLSGKSSFTVKLDDFVPKQQLDGVRKFSLGAETSDPSFVSEALTYSTFRAAGIPAPRTALANVQVDGELFGLYVMRETIDKPFLTRNFDNPEGNLYEAALGVDISDPRLEARTNKAHNDKADIAALTHVVQTSPDATFLRAAGRLVDLREFFTYWAVEAITAHLDGYASLSGIPYFNLDTPYRWDNYRPNNYYVYNDPGRGRFVLLPSGADQAFGTGLSGSGSSAEVFLPPKEASTFAVRAIAAPGGQTRFRDAVQRVLDRYWDPNALLARTDRLAALVRANGLPATREETTMAEFESAVAERRAFIAERDAAVRSQLASLPPT